MTRRQEGKRFTTIDQMEAAAKNEADCCVNKRIRGEWLEVRYDPHVGDFAYQWGKNIVLRDVAVNVLATA